jgi:hypothetical protein
MSRKKQPEKAAGKTAEAAIVIRLSHLGHNDGLTSIFPYFRMFATGFIK